MAKIRVYELAKEFGVESKAVMAKLEEMGEFVRSASSTIEAPVVRRLRQAFAIKNPHLGLADRPGVETDSETEKATEEPWLPLKMRLGDVPSQTAMQTGVPAALEQPLRDWIYDVANRAGDDTVQRSCLRLNLVMPNIKRNKDDPEEARRIFLAYDSPREGLLEVADAMLELIYQINKYYHYHYHYHYHDQYQHHQTPSVGYLRRLPRGLARLNLAGMILWHRNYKNCSLTFDPSTTSEIVPGDWNDMQILRELQKPAKSSEMLQARSMAQPLNIYRQRGMRSTHLDPIR